MSRRPLAQRYWEAYAATLEPPSGTAARTLAAVKRRIDAGEPVEHGPLPAEDRPRRAAAGVALFGKSAAVSVGIATATLLSIKLAVVGWSQLAGGVPAAVAPAAERSGVATRAQAVAPEPAEAPPPVAEPEPPVVPATEAEPRAAEPSRRSQAPAVADRLRAEVALMDRARAALERDDADALWRLTGEHARRFPDGALVEEREAWQAIAACRLGHARAAARAEAFLRAHPRSAQADKLRRACAAAMQTR
jgi:hypothetical protein